MNKLRAEALNTETLDELETEVKSMCSKLKEER